jgi:hypothetical protein
MREVARMNSTIVTKQHELHILAHIKARTVRKYSVGIIGDPQPRG